MRFFAVSGQRVGCQRSRAALALIALIVRRREVILCKPGADSGYGEYARVRESEGAGGGGLDGVSDWERNTICL
jgi:hypothetical protein